MHSSATDLLTTDIDTLDQMPLERLEAEISTFAGRLASATAIWLCWIAAYDRREGWSEWQAKSCAHWLNWRCGVAMRTAREHVRVARTLDDHQLIRAAFIDGTISYSKVRAITRVVVPENEDYLVQLALDGTASQVERVCAGMRRTDRDEGQDAKDAVANQNVSIAYNGDGTATITITAPVADAKKAHAGLVKRADAIIADNKAEGETNADAIERLAGLGRIYTETACALLDGTIDAKEMPPTDMLMIVDDDVLRRTLDGTLGENNGDCTFDHQRISPLVAKRLACDARLQLAVQDACGDALGIGRESKVVPRRIRRLLARRDKGMCRFPGCDATRRLHAHHVIHWLDGGPTELDNLVSLCHFHHHSVHEGGWNIKSVRPGEFRFIDPAGFDHRMPKLSLRSASAIPDPENGPAEPLSASGERADVAFITDVILSNTDLRMSRI